jgi:uncharacterized repeat protein (TIGR01451 family)
MKAYGLFAALFCATASHAAATPSIVVTHYEPLQRLTLHPGAPTAQQKINSATPLTLTFDALAQGFELQLEPNDRLLSRASRASLPAGIALYRGKLAGHPGSWTRIVIANDEPRGLIWDGEQMFVIEAPGDSAVQTDAPIVYRLADTYVTPGTLTCGAATGGSAATMYTKLLAEMATAQAAAPGATMEMQLSAIGDFEFVERTGAGTDAAMVTRLNNVDGIFSEQLGVQLTVGTLEVHTEEDDPFSDTLDSGDLLDELGIYRRDSPLHRSHGLTHLYTGRNLAATTVGIAYLDALCSTRFGAGLTEGRHGALFESLISAHEIGHNFGAPHDGEDGSACAAEAEDFIMAGSVNGSEEFSSCSIAQMQPAIAAASCITALPTVDMTVALDREVAPILFGETAAIGFVATNAGTETATNVELHIVLPDNLSFSPNQLSPVPCADAGGTISCQLGTMTGGSSLTASLSLIGTETGTASIVATVSSDADDNPNNNVETVEVTVVPAVDLSVDAIAAAQVGVNQNISIQAVTENRSILDATGVELSVTVGLGLEVRTAEWSLGSCNVSPQQVDCSTDVFERQSSATLNMTLTGTTAGARSYTVTLSSIEDDTDTSNNSAEAAVTVTTASADMSSSGEGGGGSADWLFLWAFSLATRCARSRTLRRTP